ncbi:porphobilinogen deaminase [Conoideocrella luteorostrata]|uniref:Porphobilinogen deaminase n=1 Tax=Conoideocrella luteorostrata TaxID=1105319 RepID=A0AAJ0CVU4_9HYPO|nr:porphobilinogen deaminase [Conoideocrella luteorostrata]
MANTITVGTRDSLLAIVQAELVVSALRKHFPNDSFPIDGSKTTGDLDTKTALRDFEGTGIWTTDLQNRLINGEVDIVVHSLKDVQTTLPESTVLGAITIRDDPRDVLVIKEALVKKHGYKHISELPEGSIIATSSIRRVALLARKYPHLKFKDVRGNLPTRLRKMEDDPEMSALVTAAAGLARMNWENRISQYLDADNGGILYAVGQGALGIECRAGDERVLQALQKLENPDTLLPCLAERSMLRELNGGCSVPIGVETKWADGKLKLRATVVSADGKEGVDIELEEPVDTRERAEDMGKKAASELVAKGADKILDAIIKASPHGNTQ